MPVNRQVFWDNVDMDLLGCWMWTAAQDAKGYGFTSCNGKSKRAHRASYEMCIGPIPDGHYVCHRCDNPGCVNPHHLFTGTPKENTRDMYDKGRNKHWDNSGEKNPRSKLTRADVDRIEYFLADGYTQSEIARGFGVTPACIRHIKSKRTWSS